jgi:hypothetical protein
MSRKAREKSGTGIYHVMLRGINHQDIFEERSDYWKFLKLLRLQTHPSHGDSPSVILNGKTITLSGANLNKHVRY